MTKPREWPNDAMYQRDASLECAMNAIRHQLRVQELIEKIAEHSTNANVLRFAAQAAIENGKGMGNNSNIVVHMQNAGARSDTTLGTHKP